ncbi:hypothetical protein GLYMA_15G251401v4 [Glycine max]|nr:hypothetical protein GLYMA_15G251401v4 [Glycine max]KAG4950378.1 hypothetical protein JHK86_043617 [Glycine max]KAH1148771.1 hypothetical protein GYH30_043409 [Glycine max]
MVLISSFSPPPSPTSLFSLITKQTFSSLHFFITFHCEMTKLRSSRLTMEVAPPRFVSVTRCRVKKMLDTIKEEENDFAADKRFSSPSCGSSSLSLVERPVLLKNF